MPIDQTTRRAARTLANRIKRYLVEHPEGETALRAELGEVFGVEMVEVPAETPTEVPAEATPAPVKEKPFKMQQEKVKPTPDDAVLKSLGPLPAWMYQEIHRSNFMVASTILTRVALLYQGKITYAMMERIMSDYHSAASMWFEYLMAEHDARLSIPRVRMFIRQMTEDIVEWSIDQKLWEHDPLNYAIAKAIRNGWKSWNSDTWKVSPVRELIGTESEWDYSQGDSVFLLGEWYKQFASMTFSDIALRRQGTWADFVKENKANAIVFEEMQGEEPQLPSSTVSEEGADDVPSSPYDDVPLASGFHQAQ